MAKLSDVALALQLQAEAGSERPDVTIIRRKAGGSRWRATAGEQWQRGRLLGEGGYGQVYLEECIGGGNVGHVRAVKKLQKAHNESYHHELNALALFSLGKYRDSFVQCFGWYATEHHIFLSMEYLPHGDLQQYLNQPLLEREGQLIMSQIMEALEWMHERNFAHRDLKPGNVLVAEPCPNWWVKVADFGISKRTEDGLTSLRTAKGTQKFVAPEVLLSDEKSPYTNAVDIWSAGMIAFLVLTGMPNMNFKSMLRYSVGKDETFPDRPLVTQGVSADGRSFVQALLQPDAKDRPSATETLQHNWIRQPNDHSQNIRIMHIQDRRNSDADIDTTSNQTQLPSRHSAVMTTQSTDPLVPTAQWSTHQGLPGEPFESEDTAAALPPQALTTRKSESAISDTVSLQHHQDTHNASRGTENFPPIVDAETSNESSRAKTWEAILDKSFRTERPATPNTQNIGSYTFRWKHPAQEVFVTGTFDDWAKSIQLDKFGSAYEKTVDLPKSGEKIWYKFVADGDWQYDPTQKFEQDLHGNINNVLYPDDIKAGVNHLVPTSPGTGLNGLQTQKRNHVTSNDNSGHDRAGSSHDDDQATHAEPPTAGILGSGTIPSAASEPSQARLLQAYDTTRERGRYGEMASNKTEQGPQDRELQAYDTARRRSTYGKMAKITAKPTSTKDATLTIVSNDPYLPSRPPPDPPKTAQQAGPGHPDSYNTLPHADSSLMRISFLSHQGRFDSIVTPSTDISTILPEVLKQLPGDVVASTVRISSKQNGPESRFIQDLKGVTFGWWALEHGTQIWLSFEQETPMADHGPGLPPYNHARHKSSISGQSPRDDIVGRAKATLGMRPEYTGMDLPLTQPHVQPSVQNNRAKHKNDLASWWKRFGRKESTSGGSDPPPVPEFTLKGTGTDRDEYVHLYIDSANGKTLQYLSVKEGSQVKDIWEQITVGGISRDKYHLVHKGSVLNDEKDIFSYGIRDQSTIMLRRRLSKKRRSM